MHVSKLFINISPALSQILLFSWSVETQLPHSVALFEADNSLNSAWRMTEYLVFSFASNSSLSVDKKLAMRSHKGLEKWMQEFNFFFVQLPNVFNLCSTSFYGASFFFHFYLFSYFERQCDSMRQKWKKLAGSNSHAAFPCWFDSDRPWWKETRLALELNTTLIKTDCAWLSKISMCVVLVHKRKEHIQAQ